MNHWVKDGIADFQKGLREQAERNFRIAIQENPRDREAWLWLAEAVPAEGEKITCLLKVLELDPRSAAARRMLENLQSRQKDENLPHISPFLGLDEPLPDSVSPASPTESVPAQPFSISVETEKKPSRWRRIPTWVWLVIGIVVVSASVILFLSLR